MRRPGTLMIAACVAGCLSLASQAAAQTTAGPGSVAAAVGALRVTATVEKIDHKKRTITLKAADGRKETFTVDEAVKNLDQMKKGDLVVATYAEALAYEVKKSGAAKPGVAAATAAVAAKPGEKPAVGAARQTSVTVTIAAIDEKAPSVTFKGPKGKTRMIKVKDPAKLKEVKVGDLVEITYTQALALSVEKAPAKK